MLYHRTLPYIWAVSRTSHFEAFSANDVSNLNKCKCLSCQRGFYITREEGGCTVYPKAGVFPFFFWIFELCVVCISYIIGTQLQSYDKKLNRMLAKARNQFTTNWFNKAFLAFNYCSQIYRWIDTKTMLSNLLYSILIQFIKITSIQAVKLFPKKVTLD